MKNLFFALIILLTSTVAFAQTASPPIAYNSDPAGSCWTTGALWINYTTGKIWFCSSPSWVSSTPSTDASNLTSGTVAKARLGSGTGDSTNFLRGDQTWSSPTASAAWGSITGTLSSQSDLQTALNGKLATPTTVILSADRTNATTSYADITDLVFSLAANTRYKISCIFKYDANATTTGIGIGWTGPASPTFVTGRMVSSITAATVGGTVSNGNDSGSVTTASAATTANSATFDGIWSNGSNTGNLQMRFKSEVAVASAIIIKAGSACDATIY